MHVISILMTALLPLADAKGNDARKFPTPTGEAAQAIAQLREAIDVSQQAETSAEQVQRLIGLLNAARQKLASPAPAAEILVTAIEDAKRQSPAQAANTLEEATREAYGMLTFEPIREADLPKGFPTYTPVGAIEVKSYPEARRAVSSNFGTLFLHITANNIAMTAPVEMDYETENNRLRQKNMTFFYGSVDEGRVGRRGRVEVVDEPAETVVAMGLRGGRSNARIADAKARLEKWIATHPEYRASGPLRVMGYNSPFIPRSKQFLEVQIPIEKVATDANE